MTPRSSPARRITTAITISFIYLCLSSCPTHSFSATVDASRQRLAAALSSPSGKLTLSPEIVIPEPKDATAILLLTDAVQSLSERIRTSQANAAFVQGSMTALQTFCNEQAGALGNFPGPVPVVFCVKSGGSRGSEDGDDSSHNNNEMDWSEIAAAGADGVLVRVCDGAAIQAASDIVGDGPWMEMYKAAEAAGIAPIPEITMDGEIARSLSESDVEAMVDAVTAAAGDEPPVSVIFTVNPGSSSDEGDNSDDSTNDEGDDAEANPVPLFKVPKALRKKIPILGSVRATAGDDRLGAENMRFREAGFTGTVLRSDCVPGFRLQTNLEVVGKFWQFCISDLKSTRSKSFGFRSKNNLETSVGTKWMNYQQNIMDSGALGDPNESSSIMDEANGDYQGF